MLIEEMTQSDCLKMLARTRLGRLACTKDNQPYIVPIYFVYEDPYLYGFTTPGQKVKWMRSNPLVCVELDEVDDSERWTSIIIFGKYQELTDTPAGELERLQACEPFRRTARPRWTGSQERLHALDLLQEYAGWWEPGCASCLHRHPEQPLETVFYRIQIDHITGRLATPNAGRLAASGRGAFARHGPGWLRRLFHPLSPWKPPAVRKEGESGC